MMTGVKTPDARLAELADLFQKKNAEYGASYTDFGPLMKAMCCYIELDTPESYGRFAIFTFMVAKLHRYATAFNRGGHADSLRDIAVYSQMLAELDEAPPTTKPFFGDEP